MNNNELMQDYEFARIQIKILKVYSIWPNGEQYSTRNIDSERARNLPPVEKSWRRFLFFWTLLPTVIPLTYDIFYLIVFDDDSTMELLHPILAYACILGENFLSVCCISNVHLIIKILSTIQDMKSFRPIEEIIDVDRKASWVARIMLFYSTIGTVAYALMPLLPASVRECQSRNSPTMISNHIPCSLACRVRVPFEPYIPNLVMKIIWLFLHWHQAFLILSVTTIVMTLTMLLCSLLMQCVYHFRQLKAMMLRLDDNGGNPDLLRKCIVYHQTIISLCQDINEAFGSQMTMFLFLPSFAISLLCFELLSVGFTEGVRFGMHLLGWIAMLLLVNFGGQLLMDESSAVAETAYDIKWYNYDVAIQKDIHTIIIRSQKPESLNASDLGRLSFETFLQVISSAYSLFTMLINMKQN